MDHAGHAGMAMGGSPTTVAMPTASAKSMGGMGGGSGCKISMLFNLYTIDSCFLSSQWRITSNAAFAGSCIGVFLLTLVLELLRRSIKEYDRYLIRQHRSRHQTSSNATGSTTGSATGSATPPNTTKNCAAAVSSITCGKAVPPFRPNALQQGIRAFLHLLAFFVGYILMLLAMYYNGYILLCIFLGAFVGAFIFQWEELLGDEPTSAAQETTLCCG
ncbi:hypothetical protein E4U13_002878 [Claviceps humidiphila]|uniref:Copper transport protein n=1 Tax=Claviceps humidiphila TaxID=1294629 RepID=A0A9P7TQ76_9HYPO|nr:hypothetical protein E4U13_002878 [Claviceps humidiphila]